MEEIINYLKEYKKEVIIGPVFKVFEAIFDLIVPIIVALIIDNGIQNNDVGYIIKHSFILIILAIAGIFFAIVAQYFAAKVAVRVGSRLREDTFKKVQTLSFKELDELNENKIINIISNDTFQIQNCVNMFLRLALRSPLIVFGSLIMSIFISIKIGLVFFIIIPVIAFIIFKITKICVPKFETVQSEKDNLLKKIKETLSGNRIIRSFGIEEKNYYEFKNINKDYTSSQIGTSKTLSLINSFNYVVINLGIIAIIYMGAIEVDNGVITTGQVVALYNYMAQILIELVKLANLLLLVPKAFASSKRINSILLSESSVIDGEEKINSNEITLTFNNVGLKYFEEDVLSEISFKVKTGEVLGIVGGTGSGKTSIVNLIPRFYDATYGEILLNNKNINQYSIKNIRDNIGIVMQRNSLFDGTIKSNIKLGNSKIETVDLENAAAISLAKEFIDKKEKGFDEKVIEGGKNLSGGQRQRLSIARAIARKPKILILDDSMSALDLVTDKKLRSNLERIRKNRILIIVSQRISTIKNADNILVVDSGKIVGQGKHEELLESCAVYKEIYNSQR